MRVETKLPDATIVQVFDGAARLGEGSRRRPRRARAGARGHPPQPAARHDRRPPGGARRHAARRGCCPMSRTEDGRFHRALELSGTDLDPMVLYIDPETLRIARQTYVAGGPGNPLIEEVFTDYRPVDGVQIAFSAAVRRGDLTVLERSVVDFGSTTRSIRPSSSGPSSPLSVRLLLSCGEPSGDVYAGALTRELRTLSPGHLAVGPGRPAVRGCRRTADRRLPRPRGHRAHRGDREDSEVAGDASTAGRSGAARAAGRARRHRLPGLQLSAGAPHPQARHSGRLLHRPQIWAWRAGRLKTIRAIAARVLVIFPFEEPIYREARRSGGVRRTSAHRSHAAASAAGHAPAPAWLRPGRADGRRAARPPAERGVADPARSRPAAGMIRARVPGAQFVVARAPNLDDDLFAVARGLPLCAIVDGETDAVLAAADVALTASGTATVQAALHDTPMVIVYRLSPLTYRLGRPLVKVDTFGMVNLIAGERIVPELIQDAFTPAAVADEAVSMLTDGTRAAAGPRGSRARARASRRAGREPPRRGGHFEGDLDDANHDRAALDGGCRGPRRARPSCCRPTSAICRAAPMQLPAARSSPSTAGGRRRSPGHRNSRDAARGRLAEGRPRQHRPVPRPGRTARPLSKPGGGGAVVRCRAAGRRVPRRRTAGDAVHPRHEPGCFPHRRAVQAGLVVTPPAVMPVSGAARKVTRGDRSRRPLALAEFEQRVRILAEDQK